MLTWMADEFTRAGLKVVPVAGWERRGRSMNPPKVVVAHHTATRPTTSDAAVNNLLVKGRPDLPGPLAHVGLGRDGTVYLIAAGRANHAGSGSWRGVTGNSYAFGIEAFNDGVGEKWPQVQLDAYDRLAAAVLRQVGRDASWLCAHREWAPRRKIDPAGIDMDRMRQRVSSLLTQPTVEARVVWVNNIAGHPYEYRPDDIASKYAVNYWQLKFARLDSQYKFTPGVWDDAFAAQCGRWGGSRQGVGPKEADQIEAALAGGGGVVAHRHETGGPVPVR